MVLRHLPCKAHALRASTRWRRRRYVAKLQEDRNIRLHIAQELTRSDLKQGRACSLMPLDIACNFLETGDMVLLDLWHEYERETLLRTAVHEPLRLRLRRDQLLGAARLPGGRTGIVVPG